MPYLNATSAKTRLRGALKYQLEQITTADGYNYNMGDVYTRLRAAGQIANLPGCCILWGREREEQGEDVDLSDGLLHMLADATLLITLQDGEDATLAQEKILADVQYRLGNYFTLPDSLGAATCLFAWVTWNEPTGMLFNDPVVGIAIGVRIRYRILHSDPSVLD